MTVSTNDKGGEVDDDKDESDIFKFSPSSGFDDEDDQKKK